VPLPEQPLEAARDLLFAPGEPEPLRPAPARRAPPPPPATVDVLAQLARHRPAPLAEAPPEIPAQEREAAIDAVMADILSDPDAAFRSIAVLYQDFTVRCRMRRLGEALDLAAFRRRLAVARAGVGSKRAAEPEWERAASFAAGLAEELQGVFLILARAALEGSPCPSDDDIARACGSRSPGRARRLVAYMETRGILVCRTDFRGNRVVALPELGWETGPGDPARSAPLPDAPPDLFAAE
jgi:hypothetical protein